MRPGPRHPLLGLRRADTEALCARLGLDVVVDPSNADPRFLRNRTRHELLALLAELSGRDPVPLLCRQAAHLRQAADHLDAESAALDPADARALAAAPPALAAAALRRWLRGAGDGHPPDTGSVERVLRVARGEVVATEVAGGWRVARRAGRLRLEPGAEEAVAPTAGSTPAAARRRPSEPRSRG
jgi:tRNA(Ile)-lysidine synthase